jgi:hypothetical protein
MTEHRPQFNWSDAWLLLAVAAASQSGQASLEKIIAAGDAINFAIFKPDELESGLVRLSEAGYIKESAGLFSLTEKVQPHAESFLAEHRAMDKRLADVEAMIGAASAPDDQPCQNNLKYPGFSKKQYDEAVLSYQGYLRDF